MSLYEHVYLARQDVTAQQVEAMTEQMKSVIEANGGKVDKIEYWGVKTLAFRIKKNRKAHFSLLNISAPPAAVTEMERQMRINEDILRFLTVSVEELEEGPSAMMQKRDRDDRDDRGDRGFGGGGGRFGGGGGRFGAGGPGGGGGGRFGDRDRGPRPPRDNAPSDVEAI
jgi:small subunit ribosomal protein S6